MNWIERLPEVKGRDLYSQNSEGLILEYLDHHIQNGNHIKRRHICDIGSGDGFILSNSRHLVQSCGFTAFRFEKTLGTEITLENCIHKRMPFMDIISIDIDGNDYWILNSMMPHFRPYIVCAEFNPAFTDARTIRYNPDHNWDGTDYYGFTFEAGKKLAEKHGYKVIFQLADMNMFMVRADLIEGLTFPEVTYKQNDFFKLSTREDWIII